jgi:hypothetical protein
MVGAGSVLVLVLFVVLRSRAVASWLGTAGAGVRVGAVVAGLVLGMVSVGGLGVVVLVVVGELARTGTGVSVETWVGTAVVVVTGFMREILSVGGFLWVEWRGCLMRLRKIRGKAAVANRMIAEVLL